MPDANMYYANPSGDNTARMQYRMLECRWEQYLNALAHILNTGKLEFSNLYFFLGQGVVLERSPHTDFVFVNAMRTKNYISPECKRILTYPNINQSMFSLPSLLLCAKILFAFVALLASSSCLFGCARQQVY